MAKEPAYPFVPKTTAHLRPGHFWQIPLSNGQFACGRVLQVPTDRRYGNRTTILAGLMDWSGSSLPTSEAIAGRAILDQGNAHVATISWNGGQVLGHRPLEADDLQPLQQLSDMSPEATLMLGFVELRRSTSNERATLTVFSTWGLEVIRVAAERNFVEPRRDRKPLGAFIRSVESPITDEQLRPLDPECRGVQFSAPLTESDFVKLARFLETYPRVSLRILGHHTESAPDLAFLRHFPFLKHFEADVFEIESWDGLQFLPDSLETLSLGATRRRFSLQPIARFTQLAELSLDGHSKDADVLAGFTRLVYLRLRSVTLGGLAPLRGLRELRSLELKLGGTHDLALLPELTSLRYLELWRVQGVRDLSPVAELSQLRYLFLQDLAEVRSLPSFATLRELRRCEVENLKGLTDLTPIAAAPNLEELVISGMRHIAVDSLACFRGHPTLRAAGIGLGSLRRDRQAADLLGLRNVLDIKPIRRYVEA